MDELLPDELIDLLAHTTLALADGITHPRALVNTFYPTVFVLPVRGPDPRTTSSEDNELYHARLRAALDLLALPKYPSTARGPNDYTDEGFAVLGLTDEQARAFALLAGQLAIYKFTAHGSWIITTISGKNVYIPPSPEC